MHCYDRRALDVSSPLLRHLGSPKSTKSSSTWALIRRVLRRRCTGGRALVLFAPAARMLRLLLLMRFLMELHARFICSLPVHAITGPTNWLRPRGEGRVWQSNYHSRDSLLRAHALWVVNVAAGLHCRISRLIIVADRAKRCVDTRVELRSDVLKVCEKLGRWLNGRGFCRVGIQVENQRSVVDVASCLQLRKH